MRYPYTGTFEETAPEEHEETAPEEPEETESTAPTAPLPEDESRYPQRPQPQEVEGNTLSVFLKSVGMQMFTPNSQHLLPLFNRNHAIRNSSLFKQSKHSCGSGPLPN